MLLLCNPYGIVYLEMTTHIHTQAEYIQQRGQPEAPLDPRLPAILRMMM